MAQTWTNAALTTALQNWLENTSTDYIDRIPEVIRLAEDRIFRDTNLRIYNFVASGTLTSGTNTITLPTDLVSFRSVTVTTSDFKENLIQKHESFLNEYWPKATLTDKPLYYAFMNETQVKVAPTPDAASNYNIDYKAHPTSLTGATDGTWMSNHAADLLFYACMVESCLFLQKFGIVKDLDQWEEKYQRALIGVRKEHELFSHNQEYQRGDK